MNETCPYAPPLSIPAPISNEVRSRKSPCGRGRAPKSLRGNRDQKLRGRILESLQGGKRVSR